MLHQLGGNGLGILLYCKGKHQKVCFLWYLFWHASYRQILLWSLPRSTFTCAVNNLCLSPDDLSRYIRPLKPQCLTILQGQGQALGISRADICPIAEIRSCSTKRPRDSLLERRYQFLNHRLWYGLDSTNNDGNDRCSELLCVLLTPVRWLLELSSAHSVVTLARQLNELWKPTFVPSSCLIC